MKKGIICFLCAWLGSILCVIWWKNTQFERIMQDLLRKNDLSKKEQILLLENAMLQYSYNEQPIEDFKLYDESGHSTNFSDLLNEDYKIVLKFSQYHCSSCVDYALKELKLMNNKISNDKILIIGAYENKRLFQIIKKKHSIDIPFYFLRTQDDSDKILNEENMPYICIVNKERITRDLLIPIKEIPYHIQKYFNIISRKYFENDSI